MKCCRVNKAFLTLITTGFRVKDLIKICKWSKIHSVWKVSVFWVFLVCIFAHLDWIRTRKTPNNYIFYIVTLWVDQCIKNESSQAFKWQRVKWAPALADELFKCAWPFCGIGVEGVNYFVRKFRCSMAFWIHLWINGSGYSRMDQVKFVEYSVSKIWSDIVCLSLLDANADRAKMYPIQRRFEKFWKQLF